MVGFIIQVAVVLLVLWRAVVRRQHEFVLAIFVLAAYPAAILAAQFVYEHFFRTPG